MSVFRQIMIAKATGGNDTIWEVSRTTAITYRFSALGHVDWGDGTSTDYDTWYSGNTYNAEHTFEPGTFRITVSGKEHGVQHGNPVNVKFYPVRLVQIGTDIMHCYRLFMSCSNVVLADGVRIPDISSIASMLAGTAITSLPASMKIPASVTSANGAFQNCTKLGSVATGVFDNLLHATHSVDVRSMLSGCVDLAGVAPALWTNPLLTQHTGCFAGCTKLDNYDDIPADWK